MLASETEVGSKVPTWLAKIWKADEKQEMLEEKSHLVVIKLRTLIRMRWNGYKKYH